MIVGGDAALRQGFARMSPFTKGRSARIGAALALVTLPSRTLPAPGSSPSTAT
jgi:hypothetical protein